LRYYKSMCLAGLRKTTNNLSQNSRYFGLNSNGLSLKHKTKALALQPIFTVDDNIKMDVRNTLYEGTRGSDSG
jgi:hypothetical protein